MFFSQFPEVSCIFVASVFFLGLSKRTTSEGLRTAFAQLGDVADAKVVTDRISGYSKGFGFVRYATLEDSAKGIAGMDDKIYRAMCATHDGLQ
ncbi:organelle RRM domain-containing protein 2, mitochondrial-like [Raphanus sativus]|uniref:Organelle RRM domain-containing protein 2, mitochondrial-like n=1 Tax=Raphanus sativus TaxID=3726 RepID=A0A9W3CL99_RAPSA|nr:organelle RRM domain-containing protein 2, mitochondrial-like [Raphanus sativus]